MHFYIYINDHRSNAICALFLLLLRFMRVPAESHMRSKNPPLKPILPEARQSYMSASHNLQDYSNKECMRRNLNRYSRSPLTQTSFPLACCFLSEKSFMKYVFFFREDAWTRADGGGGISRVLAGGKVCSCWVLILVTNTCRTRRFREGSGLALSESVEWN